MEINTSFGRTAGITAIASAGGIPASTVVLLAAVDFDTDVMADPSLLLTLDENGTAIFRWGSYLVELLAPTLLIVPATLYLWYRLKSRNHGLVTTFTVFGLAGLFTAAVGSVLRATAWPVIINAHAAASGAQAETLATMFQAGNDFSFRGMWALEQLLWGVWWLGIGLTLTREKQALGILTAVLGGAFLVGGTGWMLDIDPLARLESASIVVPVWAIWLGVVILRESDLVLDVGPGEAVALTR